MAASSTTSAGATAEPVAEDGPSFAVEDFAYPRADEIEAERGIVLKRGDGHITLAECGSADGLLEVWSRKGEGKVCFRTIGESGYLTMEIPAVYTVKGNDYETDLEMTVEGEKKKFEVGRNEWTPVGESTDPDGRAHMLVEIRTTK
ncbi:hypothetical protein G5C65_10470 [Streptomyces sp. SB3404]|uniref:Secreted protein n=1 Tax=Streptomyces boncukensis TaxID=2711219 RepID=A0A6G4WVW9_9ACTN|nr:hypothetical protein [Streptomyces boncukensis]